MNRTRERIKSYGLFIFLTVFTFILIFSKAHAETNTVTTWAKFYEIPNYGTISSIRPTVDGGYVVIGQERYKDAFVLKLDASGLIQWQKKYGTNFIDTLYFVEETKDSGYILLGTMMTYGFGDNAWIFKLDSLGNIQWQKTFTTRGTNYYLHSIQQTSDGGYIAAGNVNGTDIWIIKIDSLGNTQWQKRDDFVAFASSAQSVKQTQDGGYIVLAGRSATTGTNALVFKFDADGNTTWQKEFEIENGVNFAQYRILQISDGGYVFTDGVYVFKLDQFGDIIWQKKVGHDYNYYYGITSLQNTIDGGFVVSGGAYLPKYYGKTIKFDAAGNVLWQKSYYKDSVNIIQVHMLEIYQTADTGYIMAGNAWQGGARPALVMKLDAYGNVAGCAGELIKDGNEVVNDSDVHVISINGSFRDSDAFTLDSSAIVQDISATSRYVCVEANPDITVNPNALNFNSVELHSSSTQTVTVSNTLNVPLIINSISIVGEDANAFSQINDCGTLQGMDSCTVTVTFSPASLGVKSAVLNISSNDPDTPIVNVPLTGTGIDTIPPATISAITGKMGSNDWYVSNVTITLTATDSGSGVKEIHYTIDGAETIVPGSTAAFTISAEGTHSISYFAKDNADNAESAHSLDIRIDKTPPTITASVSPAPNANDWHNSDVTVTFTCNDTVSGIASCPAPIVVTAEGGGQTFTGMARDNAGNEASVTVIVNIDKTPPVVDLTANPNLLWPPNHKMVDVMIGGGAIDPLSGVSSIVFTVIDEYGTVQPEVSGFNMTIPLEAWREGTDKDGRNYTITAVVTDKAGNQRTSTTTVLVPHDQGK